jgi:hypothetical protein
MKRSKVELAVVNNTRWYEAIFAAHGLKSETDARVWRSCDVPPPFHSNLVVLSPTTTQADIEAYIAELSKQPRPLGWSIKDSYARLDLAALGFSTLFEADWIWRDPVLAIAPPLKSRLAWTQIASRARLVEWEHAWSGDARNEADVFRTRQFPDSLLDSADHAFFAGRLNGKIVAGGIANRSLGVVGLSNIFSEREFLEETWRALVFSIAAVFPEVAFVGYERGADLAIPASIGFSPIGKLRVWSRSAGGQY